MKRKLINSLRLLLVAAGLCMGTSAWGGEKSTIYTKALGDWSSADIVTTETAGKWLTSTSGDGNRGLFIVDGKGLMTRTRGKTNIDTGTLLLNRTANTIITFDAVWNVGDSDNKGSHQQGYNQYCSIQYGDLLVKCCLDTRSNDYSYTINGKKVSLGAAAGTLLNTDLTIHIVVNSTTNEISEFYIKNGETTLAQFSDLTDANNTFAGGTNYEKVITKSDISGVSSTNDFNYLKSITVQQETQDVETANVTFKYEDTDGNSLSAYKADQVASDVALGTEISTLISSYNATFYNGDDNKFVYSSYVVTGDYTTVQKGGNTITLKFTDYPATAYTVKAQVSGSDLTTLATGTAYLDGSTRNFWSKYVNVSGNWYVADETTYGTSITSATTNVAFTATDAIDYFFEAENMSCSRSYGTYTNNNSYSNGGGIGVYQDSHLTSTSKVAAGVYTVAVTGIVRNSSKDVNFKISYSTDGSTWKDTGKNVAYTTNSSGATTGNVTEVIIPAESYIRLTDALSGNVNDYTDYITLKKTANIPATENIVVSSAGFATYVSNYNLDFTSATTKAYKVSVAEKGVATLTEVSKVPAKTPVLLYVSGGNGSGEAIPVTTDAVSAVTGNDLVAGTGAAVATYETVSTTNDYTNMILNNVSGIGFYFANDKTVATNRAYLHIATTLAPDAVGESRMVMAFADETTGISSLTPSPSPKGEGSVYTLSGQRVEKPAKGLYIVNGKKVIIK